MSTMAKVFWVAFKQRSAIVGAALLVAHGALAAEDSATRTASDPLAAKAAPFNTQQTNRLIPTLAVSRLLHFIPEQIKTNPRTAPEKAIILPDAYQMRASTEESSAPSSSFPEPVDQYLEQSNPLAQVTSVSQLSDVQPTDWAFQALQSLVERYGAIAGYPDGTFRGNRAITRYEFAAGLNAALDRINELIAAGLAEQIRQEDILTAKRLQEEFGNELANVRSRIDSLEARTAELKANQFSTTSKLNLLIGFTLSGAAAGDDVKVERIDPKQILSQPGRGADGKPIVTKVVENPEVTLSHTVGLFMTSSFTGKDTLATSFLVANNNSPVNVYTSAGLYNTYGVPVFSLTTGIPNDLVLAEALYIFPLNKSMQMAVGTNLLWLRYFDTNAFTSAFGRGASGFNTFGSTLIQELTRTSGAIFIWRVNKQLDLRLGYIAGLDSAKPTKGLFDNNTRSVTAQLTYSPLPNINLRFLYDRGILEPIGGQIRSKPILGVADDGKGGPLKDATSDVFVFNFDWLVTPNFGLFGRYSYGSTHLQPDKEGVSEGDVRAQSVQVGLAFPDLGRKGALATLSYVVPFSVLEGRKFLVSGGGDGGTQYDIEATYFFPLTPNIAIVPNFHFIGNANNFDDNPNIYTGIVRTQFSF